MIGGEASSDVNRNSSPMGLIEDVLRFLADGAEDDGDDNRDDKDEDHPVPPNDSEVLRSSLRSYGTPFLIMMAVFCIVRMRYPRAYNIRSWSPHVRSTLADRHYGYLSWAWSLWWISDDDLRDHCGMDALCFIRILHFGLKLALMGIFNSLWLMPTYATAETTSETAIIEDPIAMTTISHVGPGSTRLLATVFAIYVFFGYVFYLILQEFEWFTEHRHKYLMRKLPQSYSVYVSHIPEEIRSSDKLLDFFRNAFSPDAVLEAHVSLNIPNLESLVNKRDNIVSKLEHAVNVEEVTGVPPTHREVLKGGQKVNSIEVWTKDLNEANQDIKESIRAIDSMHNPRSYQRDLEASIALASPDRRQTRYPTDASSSYSLSVISEQSNLPGFVDEPMASSSSAAGGAVPIPPSDGVDDDGDIDGVNENGTAPPSRGPALFNSVTDRMKSTAGGLASTVQGAITGDADGSPREAGFVTFTKLSSANAALQMIHHPTPHSLTVAAAPDPEDIYWKNVGRSHYSLQVGKLISLGLTAMLCIFWTIPVAFVTTLSSLEGLKEKVPFLEKWIDKAPWLGLLLQTLAPFFLVILNALLPIVLGIFSTFEGPVSSSVLEASLFVKLAAFMIIQTFFVSILSGSIMSELNALLENPTSVVDLLGTAIPGQSTFFVQLLLVQTFIGLGLELLRVTPLAIAFVRSLVGPKLTEKERNTTFLGLRPLADPQEFEYADVTSNAILYFMVQFVYSTTAPFTSYFTFFCFAILISGYRHQFVYNYPTMPDSGGVIWTSFIQTCIPCILIAQITLIGLLLLKKSVLATPFMVPLIIFTILFRVYINDKHFYVTKFLPSRECLSCDLKNQCEGEMDNEFLRGQYLQPAMQSKEAVLPENFSVAREIAQQEVRYLTPPSSECEIIAEGKYYLAEGDEKEGADHEPLQGNVTFANVENF